MNQRLQEVVKDSVKSLFKANRVARWQGILKPMVRGRVLDVGCDNGEIAAGFLDQDTVESVVGIDPHFLEGKESVQIPIHPNFTGTAIPFGDGLFDTVICSFVLHHSKSDEDAIFLVQEMRRVVAQTTGVVVVLEERIESTLEHCSSLLLHGGLHYFRGMAYRRNGLRTVSDWHQFFEQQGFIVTQEQPYPSGLWYLPFSGHQLFVLRDSNSNLTNSDVPQLYLFDLVDEGRVSPDLLRHMTTILALIIIGVTVMAKRLRKRGR